MPVTEKARRDLVEAVPHRLGQQNSASLVGPDSPLFDMLVGAEHECFPEITSLPTGNFAFWLVTRGADPLYAMRLSFPSVANGVAAPYLIHEVEASGQMSAAAIASELRERGIEVSLCLSVESSFRIAKRSARSSALFAYFGVALYARDTGRHGVLAHQNGVARRSFERVGMEYEDVSFTKQLFTPSISIPQLADDRYRPILIPASEANSELFSNLSADSPQLADFAIDLRDAPATQPSEIRVPVSTEDLHP